MRGLATVLVRMFEQLAANRDTRRSLHEKHGRRVDADVSSRRTALRMLGRATLSVTAFLLALPLKLGAARGALRTRQDERVFVSDLEDLPTGSGKTATYKDLPVVLTNDDGTVRAFLAICTHEGCVVRWSPAVKMIQCPCHDGRFDLQGAVVSGPPPGPLSPLKVFIEGKKIFITNAE